MIAFAANKKKKHNLTFEILWQTGNIVRKGENAGYQHFLLFQGCFLSYESKKSLF